MASDKMIWFSSLKLLGTMCLASPPGFSQTFEDWRIEMSKGYVAAITENESGTKFGIFCTKKCVYVLDLKLRCKDGQRYAGLLSSEKGGMSVELYCSALSSGRYVLLLSDFEGVNDFSKSSMTIGIAVVTTGGTFNVNRFSMKGAVNAISFAASLADERNKRDAEPADSGATGTQRL